MNTRVVWLTLLLLIVVGVGVLWREQHLAVSQHPTVGEHPGGDASEPAMVPAQGAAQGAETRRRVAQQAPDAPAGARAPGPRVRRAAVEPEDVQHAVPGLAPVLHACYTQRVAAGARPKGRLMFEFTLVKAAGYGTARGLTITDEGVGDAALLTCLRAAAIEPFPVPGGDGEIVARLPFDLPPPGAADTETP